MTRTYRLAELSWGNSSLRFSNQENDTQAEHYLTALKGWFGGVGVKGEDVARLAHGDFLSRKHRGPRGLVLEATLVYTNEESRDIADRFVSGVLWDGEPGTLKVTTGDHELSATVLLDGDVAHEYVGKNAVRIQVPLKAPDPFLYGEVKHYQMFPAGFGEGLEYNYFSEGGILTYGNSVATSKTIIENRGNAEAFPVFVIEGDFPSGITLTDGHGKTLEFPSPIFSQSPVTIDMRGSVLVNGIDQSHLLTRRDWFSIGPGEYLQPRITAIQQGNGWANIELSDTYI